MRKSLTLEVKVDVLAQAAPPCENCGSPSSFARFTDIANKKVGRFAHIRAVGADGPRYDPDYPADKVDSSENLFWCCTDCHDIVDYQERWTIDRLLTALHQSRSRSASTLTLTVEGEIDVNGEHAENITGLDASGRTAILKPGTMIRVSGRDAKNITGVKT